MLDNDSPICFNLSISLLDEVLFDAIIGMRKIVDSSNNCVESPNSFKIAAYLSYWWLRHKPVYLHYPIGFRLEDAKIVRDEKVSDEEYDKKCNDFSWQLKHINELVAVQMVSTFIFDFEHTLCDKAVCAMIKHKEKDKFCFTDFEEMRNDILKKLTYYFSYRAIAPKMIEHILEGYTFHPAWGLTGKHWNTGEELQ